tara:strand:+ start:56 stop:235 length:180 start_codon:yes stop_codon:yes gene_type:complete
MRTDKQIMAAAQRDIRLLTDKEYDRYREIQDNRSVKKVGGGMVKGFSPIARPQRFKGVF